MTRPIGIPYVTEDFPSGTIPNGSFELGTNWDEILWAALTVGRPNRQYVLRYGKPSAFEALFRISLVRVALEQRTPGSYRLRRTAAAKSLDPSEKGAINYFLGIAVCKLFAAKLLETPWVLHLDVFRQQLNAVLFTRSRPDLVGIQNGTGAWLAFECKGRVSKLTEAEIAKAKQQAMRIATVDGRGCTLHVGTTTFFQNEGLNFRWRDPEPATEHGIHLRTPDDAWRYYYSPFTHLVRLLAGDSIARVSVPDADIEVGIHPRIAPLLSRNENRTTTPAISQSS
jgi:hypothetical protein